MNIRITIPIWVALFAQPKEAPPAPDPDLAKPYVDGHYGFSIRPPNDWDLVPLRTPDESGDVLLRMVRKLPDGYYHEIRLEHPPTPTEQSVDSMLTKMRNLFHLEFNNDKVESQQLQPIAGRPGGLFAATYESGGYRKLRLQAVVQWRPRYFLMLMYDGPEALRAQNEPLFHKVLSSLEQIPDRFDEATIRKALRDGADWLKQRSKRELEKSLIPESFYRIDVGGKAIGFVEITQAEAAYKGFRAREIKGIEIRERGWTFGDNHWARRTQRDLFLGYDLENEQWKTRITTLIPGEGDRSPTLDAVSEDGLRKQDVLLSNQAYQLNQPPVVNTPFRLPPAYISRVLQRLLPRLLKNLAEPRLLAFASFDHSRIDLVFRVIELKGRSDMPNGITVGKVYRIDESEGLSAEPSQSYIDETGVVLLVKSGEFTMTRVERSEVEKLFGARIAAAKRTMHELEQAYQADEARFNRDHRPGGK